MNKIEEKTNLFIKKKPRTFGYSTNGNIIYNIKDARIPLFRLKEWDFFQIVSENFTMFMIIGHVSYATSLNFTIYDFKQNKTYYVGKLLPFKKVKLEDHPNNDCKVAYQSKKFKIEMETKNKDRYFHLEADDKTLGKCLVDIKMEPRNNGILVATAFEDDKQFYLNNKMCLLKPSGKATLGDINYHLDDNCYGIVDWGRGYLPFSHQWIWGSGAGLVNGKYFGFNIGKFGNNENGSENIFYYDNKEYKMNTVEISLNEDNVYDKWHYKSDNGNFVFEMKPLYDNHTKTKVLFVDNECHQMFGKFYGYIIVDNEKIEISDFFAFTEIAHNRW